jgi:hypothetical protein
MVDYRKRFEEAERPYKEAIERDRREAQRQQDELQAWSDDPNWTDSKNSFIAA